MNDFLKLLFDDEAKFILRSLCKEYPDIDRKVEELVSKKLTEFDIDYVANEIFSALGCTHH